ncbi:hypothetical protein CSE45_3018 [Citreicella sp. SE45]|nr:hypothetical protein CSE45_3018 [Citreicella sp. SE45]
MHLRGHEEGLARLGQWHLGAGEIEPVRAAARAGPVEDVAHVEPHFEGF